MLRTSSWCPYPDPGVDLPLTKRLAEQAGRRHAISTGSVSFQAAGKVSEKAAAVCRLASNTADDAADTPTFLWQFV